MQLQENPIGVYLKGPQRPAQKVKRVGRPRKETPEYYAALLRDHTQIEEWFKTEKGRVHRSDAELYTALRKHVLESQSFDSPAAAQAAEELLLAHLKTAMNALGRARGYFRESPENMPITGMDRIACDGSNVSKDVRERHERN